MFSSKILVLWSSYLLESVLISKKSTVSISERSGQIRKFFSNTRELIENMVNDLTELASEVEWLYKYVFGKFNLCKVSITERMK